MTRKSQILGLAGWLVLVFSTAAIGSAASLHAANFYGALVRPPWAPPGTVFGPVWSALYLLMGVAAWLVWQEARTSVRRDALRLFLVQLALNALWSWLFFAWHQGRWAFAEILVLWGFIAANLVAFWRVRTLAGAMLLPYLAWISFAAALEFRTWQLNPALLGP